MSMCYTAFIFTFYLNTLKAHKMGRFLSFKWAVVKVMLLSTLTIIEAYYYNPNSEIISRDEHGKRLPRSIVPRRNLLLLKEDIWKSQNNFTVILNDIAKDFSGNVSESDRMVILLPEYLTIPLNLGVIRKGELVEAHPINSVEVSIEAFLKSMFVSSSHNDRNGPGNKRQNPARPNRERTQKSAFMSFNETENYFKIIDNDDHLPVGIELYHRYEKQKTPEFRVSSVSEKDHHHSFTRKFNFGNRIRSAADKETQGRMPAAFSFDHENVGRLDTEKTSPLEADNEMQDNNWKNTDVNWGIFGGNKHLQKSISVSTFSPLHRKSDSHNSTGNNLDKQGKRGPHPKRHNKNKRKNKNPKGEKRWDEMSKINGEN